LKRLFEGFVEEKEAAKILFDLTKGMDDFAQRALRDMDDIKLFMRDNNENFKILKDVDVLEKVKSINEFLNSEDPRREFRHIKKAFDEVKAALNAYVQQLKEEVKDLYLDVFAELEKEAKNRKVGRESFADKDYILNGIETLTSLSTL